MTRFSKAMFLIGVAGCCLHSPVLAQTDTLYGNSASAGNNPIHIVDKVTGAEQQRYTGQPSGNGRGVVTVGDTIYYTVVSDPNIYKMDKNTGNTFGSILTENASMSTLAWDGSFFWTADYSGTNQAFKIDPATGMNVKTITLDGAQEFMDGLEYFNGKLIGNRCDACNIYDIWDLDGNLLQGSFITGPYNNSTGIAFDGTNFYISNIFNNSYSIFDQTGTFLDTIGLTGDGGFLIEDLSFDYSQRPDTGGGGGDGAVPEPSSWMLLLLGFFGLGTLLRRRRESGELAYR